jgi:hypothetical protein
MKNAVFWDVTSCDSYQNRRFGGNIASIITATTIGELATDLATEARCRLLITANIISSSPILVTLMMEAICSTEMPGLTRATRRSFPEDSILYYMECSLKCVYAPVNNPRS